MKSFCQSSGTLRHMPYSFLKNFSLLHPSLICLSVSLSVVCLSVYLPIYLPFYLSVYLSSICLPTYVVISISFANDTHSMIDRFNNIANILVIISKE